MHIYPFVFLTYFEYLSIYLSIYIYIYIYIYIFLWIQTYLSITFCAYRAIYLFICLCLFTSIYLSIYLLVCLPAYLPVCMFKLVAAAAVAAAAAAAWTRLPFYIRVAVIFISDSTIFLASRNVIFLLYFTFRVSLTVWYLLQVFEIADGSLDNLGIWSYWGNLPPCGLVFLATFSISQISSSVLPVESIFLIFKILQRFTDELSYLFKAEINFHFLGIINLLNIKMCTRVCIPAPPSNWYFLQSETLCFSKALIISSITDKDNSLFLITPFKVLSFSCR